LVEFCTTYVGFMKITTLLQPNSPVRTANLAMQF
jgi:hypothetical protein